MSLRTKTFIVLVLTLCLIVGLFFFLSKNVILQRFEHLETMEAAKSMERVRSIIDQEYERLFSTGVDWGSWSDTYEFVSSGNKTYIENNLDNESVGNLGLNLMLYVNTKGDLVFGKAMDLERGVQTALPGALAVSILNNESILGRNLQGESVYGLLSQAYGPPVFFASVPILQSNGEGPVRGSLVLGKFLTASKLEQISQVAKISLSMETGPSVLEDLEGGIGSDQFPGGESILIQPESSRIITGTLFLRDFSGDPALALKSEMPRDIFLMGQSALLRFLLLVLAMTAAVSLIVWIVLEKMILSRLYKVINQISRIRQTKDSGSSVKVSGSDELALLANSINGMLAAIHESNLLYQSLIKTSPIPIMAADTNGKVTEWNPAAEDVFGWSRAEVLGRFPPILPADKKTEFENFRKKLIAGSRLAPFEAPRVRKDGTSIELRVYPSRLIDFDGLISGSISIMTDITDIKNRNLQLTRNLSEKDMLLKEVHHRIKNNLQAISSILDIQKMHINNPQLSEVFRESQNRIRSMALIHEELHRSGSENHSKDTILVNTRQYVTQLLDHLFFSYNVDRTKVHLDFQVEDFPLDIDTAIPCGLIINELVSNCLKHAFNDQKSGRIHVHFTKKAGSFRLRITDDGVGLPENMDSKKARSLGLTLVKSFAEQLKGTIKISGENGTTFELTF